MFNVALKLAILRTVRSQVRLAALTGFREDRISRIVNGWSIPTAVERWEIARLVGESEQSLFDTATPSEEAAPVGPAERASA